MSVTKLIDTEQFDKELSEIFTEEVVDNSDNLEKQITSNVPDKFKGKSLEDVIQSYTNLEKEMGRKNNELGELRKLTDDILKQELSKPKQEEKRPKIDLDKFYEDPDAEIERVVEHRLKGTTDKLAQIEKQAALKEFETKHPNWRDVHGSSEFEQFVMASPLRQRLYARADSYDLEAADDLFNLYKEYSDLKASSLKAEQARQKEDGLKKASSESGSTGASTRKVYKRSDLIRLKMQDPAKYQAMEPEIMAAYAEGRVK